MPPFEGAFFVLESTMKHLLLLAIPAILAAQSPIFEVASVRPAEPGLKGMNVRRDPAGGIDLLNVNVRTLIVLAYNVQDFQVSGTSGWMESERFNVMAKAPTTARKSDTWLMLRALLAERFHLETHRE